MTWTADRVAVVRCHWGGDKSAAEIGELIGKSKDAVIGKAHRLGLAGDPPSTTREGRRMGGAKSKPTVWTDRMVALLRRQQPTKTASELAQALGLPIDAVKSKIQRLRLPSKRWGQVRYHIPEPETCLWLHGESRNRDFCGDACRESTSYCPAHYLRCHQPAYRAEAA